MKRIHVEVTKEDIAQGEQTNCVECPVARATQRALACGEIPGRAEVYGSSLWIIRDSVVERKIWLPAFVSLKIQLFDSTGEMEPFGFEIEV